MFFSALLHVRKKLHNRFTKHGMSLVRRNLCKRFQHEIAVVHIPMGNRQFLLIHHPSLVEKNVQIKRPRSPALLPLSRLRPLNSLQLLEVLQGDRKSVV